MGDDMLGLEQHVPSLFKDVENVALDVFARQADQNPPRLELQGELLQIGEARRNGDAIDPVFANNAAPQCVVTVENQNLPIRDKKSMDLTRNRQGQARVMIFRERDM